MLSKLVHARNALNRVLSSNKEVLSRLLTLRILLIMVFSSPRKVFSKLYMLGTRSTGCLAAEELGVRRSDRESAFWSPAGALVLLQAFLGVSTLQTPLNVNANTGSSKLNGCSNTLNMNEQPEQVLEHAELERTRT